MGSDVPLSIELMQSYLQSMLKAVLSRISTSSHSWASYLLCPRLTRADASCAGTRSS